MLRDPWYRNEVKRVVGVLQIIASESRPQKYMELVLPSRQPSFNRRDLYSPMRNGKICALTSLLLLKWEDIP